MNPFARFVSLCLLPFDGAGRRPVWGGLLLAVALANLPFSHSLAAIAEPDSTPQGHLNAAQAPLAKAAEQMRTAGTTNRQGFVQKSRTDIRQAQGDLSAALDFLNQNPTVATQPAADLPAFATVRGQLDIAHGVGAPQPNLYAALISLKETLAEAEKAGGGAWDGNREKLVNDIGQAGADIIAAIKAVDPTAGAVAAQSFTPEEMNGIVVLEGDKGVATGFLAKVHNVDFIVTNLHVLGENAKLSAKRLDGTVIPWQGIVGAVGSDIALLRLVQQSNSTAALPQAADVLKSSKIGDKVVVVGNRLGGGVATQTLGQIKGIGPQRVEVDAAFQPGNSGSPIFDLDSQNVIGVATYAETVTTQIPNDSAADTPKAAGDTTGLARTTRWFGYRLDTVAKWEAIDPDQWREQMGRVADFRDASLGLLDILQGKLSDARSNDRLRVMVDQFETKANETGLFTSGAKPTSDAVQALHEFLANLHAFSQQGVKDFATGDYYDYFRSSLYWQTSIADQVQFREALVQAIEQIQGNVTSFQKRLQHS